METCRVCLTKGTLTSIYEKDLNNITLCDKIMECGGILIRPSLELPELICSKCMKNLDVAYNFRQTCKRTDSIFQLYLKANNKNNIFVTLSNGITYKLPEELKLKLVKVKEPVTEHVVSENLRADEQNTIFSTIKHEDEDEDKSYETNVSNDNFIDMGNEEIVHSECDNVSEGEQYIEDENDNLDNDENRIEYHFEEDKDGYLTNTEHIQSEFENEKIKQEDTEKRNTDKRTRTKDNNLTRKKDHVTLKTIINHIRKTTSSKYIQYSSDSDSDCNRKSQSKPISREEKKPEEKPSFICEICGNVYKINSLLLTHMRRHTNERPYSCEICGKSFVTSSLMARHIKIHTGHRPYKCQFCSRKFYERGTCRAHEKVHSGERPYECLECSKRFIYSQSLTKHMLIHTGEKLYRCELCGKEFRLLHHLKAHMQTNIHKNLTTTEKSN